MKHVRLLVCIALFAIAFAAVGRSEEAVDVRALQAKLAAQEAILTDLEARANYRGSANANYGGAPEALVSLNKNALVTVGGQLNTRYFYHSGKLDGVYWNRDASLTPATGPAGENDGVYRRRAKISQGDLTITDAKLYVDVQVNDHFDAFLQIDLQSSQDTSSDNAEKYYVRWKNICNTGFGIKVGRDALVFGEDFGVGVLANYSKGGDGAFSNGHWGRIFLDINSSRLYGQAYIVQPTPGNLQLVSAPFNGGLPRHNYWDKGRITQITPYWEFCDGKFSAEISLFQDSGNSDSRLTSRDANHTYLDGGTYKSHNYGASASARLRWKPIEGLILSASAVNYRSNYYKNANVFRGGESHFTRNNTAVDLAFNYRPRFLPALQVWGQFIHGWDVDFLKDVDAYSINYGASYDFCERWTVFASGDWLANKDSRDRPASVPANQRTIDEKATAWAVYGGIRYLFPNGVDIEAGWKHEEIKLRQNLADSVAYTRDGIRRTTLKASGDTAYVHLGFTF